jgi:hypothetical protein
MSQPPKPTPLSTERPDVEALRERSGSVKIDSHLVSFLYELMRDHVPPGVIEEIMRKTMGPSAVVYTNGWLAKYAEDVANRLVPPVAAAPPVSSVQPRRKDPRVEEVFPPVRRKDGTGR